MVTQIDYSATAKPTPVIRIGSWGAEYDRSVIMSSAAKDAMYSPNTSIRKGTILYDTGTGGLHLPYTIMAFYLGKQIAGISMDDAILIDNNGNAITDNVNIAQVGAFRDTDIWMNYDATTTAANLFFTLRNCPDQATFEFFGVNLIFKAALLQALRGQPVLLNPAELQADSEPGMACFNSPLINSDLNIIIRS